MLIHTETEIDGAVSHRVTTVRHGNLVVGILRAIIGQVHDSICSLSRYVDGKTVKVRVVLQSEPLD